jgi:hypothetical protein
VGTNHIAIIIPEKGTYYLNKTLGEVTLFENSSVKIYYSKENLVFSFPLQMFPYRFPIESYGYYVIVLENATVSADARLVILKESSNPVYGVSFQTQLTGSIFSSAGIISLICFSYFTLVIKRVQRSERLETVEEFGKLPGIWRVLFASFSIAMCFLTMMILIAPSSGAIFSLLAIILPFVTLPLLILYWVDLEKIIGVFLNVFGCAKFFLMQKIVRILVVCIYLFFGVFAVLTILLPIFTYLYATFFMFIFIPMSAVTFLLSPFDQLSSNVLTARLSLEKFLSEYNQDPEGADFTYLRKASNSIATLLSSYNVPISPAVLAEHISKSQLKTMNRCSEEKHLDDLLKRLLESLKPLNVSKLVDVISEIPELKVKELPKYRKIFESLSPLSVIISAIVSVILLLMK